MKNKAKASKDEKLYILSESALKKTWDNNKDERWNNVRK